MSDQVDMTNAQSVKDEDVAECVKVLAETRRKLLETRDARAVWIAFLGLSGGLANILYRSGVYGADSIVSMMGMGIIEALHANVSVSVISGPAQGEKVN